MNLTPDGLRVSPFQASGGISALQSRASGLQSTTQGNSIHAKTNTHMYIYIYIYMYTCIYIHVYIYIYIYTHKATRDPQHSIRTKKTPRSQTRRACLMPLMINYDNNKYIIVYYVVLYYIMLYYIMLYYIVLYLPR